jgi:hypothetical protein
MTAYDDWLEQPFQEAEARLEAIEQRAEELLEDQWNPKNIDNFIAAAEGGGLDPYRSDIANAINNKLAGTSLLGELVWHAVYDYCYKEAQEQARSEIDNGVNHE